MNLLHPITVQDTVIAGNLFLAPLAGYTDVPFRTLCIEGGADLTHTEMVSAEGLARNSGKTLDLLERAEGERQYVVQLFASSAAPIPAALDHVLAYRPTIIDINCGCPVPKVTKTGAGSALMRNPETITEIVRAITDRTDIPVSVKFRLGWDAASINYLTFAQAALDGGATMLTLHARTRTQGYAPTAHWSHLTTLKRHCLDHGYRIPVIGSGDLFEAKDAIAMLEETGIDGVMFARGAIGNPFIFDQTKALAEGKAVEPFGCKKRVETIIRHLDLMIERHGEKTACTLMRKHVGPYLKGIPHASPIKQQIMLSTSRSAYLTALQALFAGC